MRTSGSSWLAVPVLALLFMAACGGPAAPQKASSAHTGAVSGGGGGKSATSPAGSAGTSAPEHAWGGGAAWGSLAKLGNYAYQGVITTSDGGKSVTVTVQARYHSPTNYELTIRQGKQHPSQLILASNGHRYLAHGGQQAPMDLGAAGSKSPFGALFDAYEMQVIGPWTGLFTGSRGTYSGPCSVLGRGGSAFRVGGSTPAGVGALTGLGEKVAGSACIDARTKAALKAEFDWSMGSGSKTVTYSDRFQVVAIGTVPAIAAPSGAKPFPGAPGA